MGAVHRWQLDEGRARGCRVLGGGRRAIAVDGQRNRLRVVTHLLELHQAALQLRHRQEAAPVAPVAPAAPAAALEPAALEHVVCARRLQQPPIPCTLQRHERRLEDVLDLRQKACLNLRLDAAQHKALEKEARLRDGGVVHLATVETHARRAVKRLGAQRARKDVREQRPQLV